jgi:hypothetical protein
VIWRHSKKVLVGAIVTSLGNNGKLSISFMKFKPSLPWFTSPACALASIVEQIRSKKNQTTSANGMETFTFYAFLFVNVAVNFVLSAMIGWNWFLC